MRSPEQDPSGAHATRRWSPCSGSRLPSRAATCISTPGPGNTFLWQGLSYLTARPFKGGRSAAQRDVSVGMPVHPRKRTKHGRRVTRPSGPSERRSPNASARGRARTSHRALRVGTINSDEHDAKHGVRSGPEQQARSEPASEGVRHHPDSQPRKTAR
jgi:hypothetical protein